MVQTVIDNKYVEQLKEKLEEINIRQVELQKEILDRNEELSMLYGIESGIRKVLGEYDKYKSIKVSEYEDEEEDE